MPGMGAQEIKANKHVNSISKHKFCIFSHFYPHYIILDNGPLPYRYVAHEVTMIITSNIYLRLMINFASFAEQQFYDFFMAVLSSKR